MRVDHDISLLKKWLFGHLGTWILGGPWGGRKEKGRVAVPFTRSFRKPAR
jgi:hypothetical protein